MSKYEIYTDGACSNNQGEGLQTGGWGAIFKSGLEISGNDLKTTNNRMEIKAIIEALKKTEEGSEVKIYSDSAYVINMFKQGWINNWEKNGFKNSKNKPVKNQDLVKELRSLEKERNVTFIKVKGHSGDEYNEKADKLAVDAMSEILDEEIKDEAITIYLNKEEKDYLKEILKEKNDNIAKELTKKIGR